MPSDSTDVFGEPAGETSSDAPVLMSRRAARAAREAAEAAQPAEAAQTRASETPAASVSSAVAQAHPVVTSATVAAAKPRVIAPLKRPRRNPARAVASMLVVTGLFAVAGLPAFGQGSLFTDDDSLAAAAADAVSADAATVSAQSITVSGDLALPELERDQFKATSPEDLELIRQQSADASANALYAASGAQALGDDYPWATAGYNLSPLNYYYRQCTDFVAWRLNRDVGSFSAPFRWAWVDLTPNGGDASQWKSAWDAHGWTVSATPVVGSVAWFGWENHVAYVKTVNDNGTVLVEEYNYVNRVYSQRTLVAADVDAFLYPPGQ